MNWPMPRGQLSFFLLLHSHSEKTIGLKKKKVMYIYNKTVGINMRKPFADANTGEDRQMD